MPRSTVCTPLTSDLVTVAPLRTIAWTAESALVPCAAVAVLSEVTVTDAILPSVSLTVNPIWAVTPDAAVELTSESNPDIASAIALPVAGFSLVDE